MKDFKLDLNGDIILDDGDIAYVTGSDLTAQKIFIVTGTNKGEWVLNKNEEKNFGYILGKGITDDMIMTQITDGLRQVDEALYLNTFECIRDSKSRGVRVVFSASDTRDTVFEVTRDWN